MLTEAPQSEHNSFQMMLVFLVPPWAVYRRTGISRTFWNNVALTALGVYPGVLHGVFVELNHMR